MSERENGAASLLYELHEDRLVKIEDRMGNIDASFRAHSQTDELQFNLISSQLTELKDVMVGRFDKVDSVNAELDSKLARHQDSIVSLKAKENARSKRDAWLRKALWIVPGALLAEIGHQLAIHFLRLH